MDAMVVVCNKKKKKRTHWIEDIKKEKNGNKNEKTNLYLSRQICSVIETIKYNSNNNT